MPFFQLDQFPKLVNFTNGGCLYWHDMGNELAWTQAAIAVGRARGGDCVR